LTRVSLRFMLAPIHPHMAASCAVFAQEHVDDARGIPIASMLPKRSPSLIPLSGPAATPDLLGSPPMGGTSLGRLHQHTRADSKSYLSQTAMQARWLDCRAVALSAR
jgi:hypothetical protein